MSGRSANLTSEANMAGRKLRRRSPPLKAAPTHSKPKGREAAPSDLKAGSRPTGRRTLAICNKHRAGKDNRSRKDRGKLCDRHTGQIGYREAVNKEARHENKIADPLRAGPETVTDEGSGSETGAQCHQKKSGHKSKDYAFNHA